MSWEAVAWANRQKMKKSYEQIILLVLANSADPDGEAFSKWPFKDHWWVYLTDHTRLSRASVFRHLKTITALGLGERSVLVLADGSRRPTIKLNLSTSFDIDNPVDRARYENVVNGESPIETDDEHGTEEKENGSNINESQTETPAQKSESPIETPDSSLRPETEPVSVQRLHKDSNLIPIDSPLPPSGGVPVRDDLFEEFVRSWGEPIPKMALARSAWEQTPSAKRGEVVASAKGYWTWLKAHPKPPSAQSAQSFIRDAAGWAQWLRYTPDAGGLQPSISSSYPLGSREGQALLVLHEIAGVEQYLRSYMIRNGAVNYLRPITPRVAALADATTRGNWIELTNQQAAAWNDLLRESVTVQARRPLREGSRAPWPWPPRKDGTLSATGPPESLMTEQDMAEDFR